MAAGKIQKSVTYSTGNTVPVEFWTDNTASPTLVHQIQVINDTTGAEVLGTTADAKSTATDTTAISFMSVFKQISASVQAVNVTGVDGSSTITAGGTAQDLFSSATPTNGFAVYNPDASEDLWISLSTTAVANGAGCIRIAANGGGYETPPNMKPFHAISIVGATTGHKFTAIKW